MSILLIKEFNLFIREKLILNNISLDLNKELSKELNLSIAEMPWHNNRENIVELASVLTSITSTPL